MLADAVLDGLAVQSGGVYVDCTFGRGGHTRQILDALDASGQVVALDRDPEAIEAARHWAADDTRLSFVQTTFDQLESVLTERELVGQVGGILFDLGVSSPQLDEAARGFSFTRDGPLDMRMNPLAGQPVADWLNAAPETDIAQVLKRYGEERHARRIARRVGQVRADRPLRRTKELADLVSECYPTRDRNGPRHPATRTFQALRIHINDELRCLEDALPQALRCLAPGGRLAVISFHSLEDRIVKRFLRAEHREPGPVKMPVPSGQLAALDWMSKPVRASEAECEANPRARSATLRVGRKRQSSDASGGDTSC